jgi:hypothetical protein
LLGRCLRECWHSEGGKPDSKEDDVLHRITSSVSRSAVSSRRSYDDIIAPFFTTGSSRLLDLLAEAGLMFGPPPPIAEQHRAIMREVALTYRREARAAEAEGAKPPEWHHRAYEAARAKYVEWTQPRRPIG